MPTSHRQLDQAVLTVKPLSKRKNLPWQILSIRFQRSKLRVSLPILQRYTRNGIRTPDFSPSALCRSLSEVAYVNMLLRSWPGLRRHLPENKKKEEVTLLFLEVALFENSNKGEGGVDPFLPRSTTHSLHGLSSLFCRPRSRFQLRLP